MQNTSIKKVGFFITVILVFSMCLRFYGVSAKPTASGNNHQLTEEEWAVAQSFVRHSIKPIDASNRYLHNKEAITFGKSLFFSTRLSKSDQFSCASCHQPERNWADGLALAKAKEEGARNTPSLWNTAFNRWYFWDGRSDSAWSQALGPLENPIEMAGNRLAIAHLLANDADYYTAYTNIFGDDLIQFRTMSLPAIGSPLLPANEENKWAKLSETQQVLVNRIFANVGKALAAFEATLISPPSTFDDFIEGTGNNKDDKNALSPKAIAGFRLFIGKAGCVTCHMGPELTNGEFHNIRLLTYDGGRYQGIRKLFDSEFTQLSAYSDNTQGAKIRYVKQVKRNWGEFKVPSLRRVSYSEPYMHDGRFKQLGDVVNYYSELTGAISDGHVDETIIKPLKLSTEEKQQLVEFLKVL